MPCDGMTQQELQGKQTENLPADHLKRKQWRKKIAGVPVQELSPSSCWSGPIQCLIRMIEVYC